MENEQEKLQEMFEYLDDLRACGDTNMFGAAPYLQQEFMVSSKEARKILTMWMSTYDGHTNLGSRVSNALPF